MGGASDLPHQQSPQALTAPCHATMQTGVSKSVSFEKKTVSVLKIV